MSCQCSFSRQLRSGSSFSGHEALYSSHRTWNTRHKEKFHLHPPVSTPIHPLRQSPLCHYLTLTVMFPESCAFAQCCMTLSIRANRAGHSSSTLESWNSAFWHVLLYIPKQPPRLVHCPPPPPALLNEPRSASWRPSLPIQSPLFLPIMFQGNLQLWVSILHQFSGS